MNTIFSILSVLISHGTGLMVSNDSNVLLIKHSSAIRVYADFVEWSSWNSTPLLLPQIRKTNPNYEHEASFLRLLAALGYRHPSTSLRGPYGLWRVTELATRRNENYEFVLLGSPEMEFGSTFVRTDSQVVAVRVIPPHDSSNTIAIIATCEQPDCAFRVVTGGKEHVFRNRLTIEAQIVQKECALFMAFCRYLLTGKEIETVWGADWERTNSGRPDIVIVPPDEAFPLAPEDSCNRLLEEEEAELLAEWQRVGTFIETQCATRKGLESLPKGWINQQPITCISLDEKHVTFGKTYDDVAIEYAETTTIKRRLLLQAVFYRPSRRCSSIYVSLRE